jgi:CTP synthase
VVVRRIESEEIEQEGAERLLRGVDGILVPGGFGTRGVEGKVQTIRFAREREIPFFGICLGLQCAVIEFARHALGLKQANSTEFEKSTEHPVVCLLEEQRNVTRLGGTMRLGAYPCQLQPGSLAAEAYGLDLVQERHRHRYEFNNDYLDRFAAAGMSATGKSPDGQLVEIVEVADHPWFLAVQFHPEFKSKPIAPHPLFKSFVRAALQRKRSSKGVEEPQLT